MGSKNRIFLGIITNFIFHYLRNIFDKKELYITKLKVKKIGKKHPEIVHFILQNNFQKIIDNTFAHCNYEQDGVYNLLAFVDGRYILYSVSINNFHLECGTLFYTSKRQLKKCFHSMVFFNKEMQKELEEFLS